MEQELRDVKAMLVSCEAIPRSSHYDRHIPTRGMLVCIEAITIG
jgi:hypothetical protein